MKEKPILFSGPMVRAILDGRKTQTRRIIFPRTDYTLFSQPTFEGLELDPTDSIRYDKEGYVICDKISDEPKLYALKGLWALFEGDQFYEDCAYIKCPYGEVGDILWVRETWWHNRETWGDSEVFLYRADFPIDGYDHVDAYKWKPSIFMPKDACRIKLRIIDIRVERLQNISNEDAIAEGINMNETPCIEAMNAYAILWESINGKGSWDKNPWVWVITFERI
jgi:hypothetical protein